MNDRHACNVCGNSEDNPTFTVLEMQYGLEEPFDYFQCSACQCLQIAEFPDDMERHYPRAPAGESAGGSSDSPVDAPQLDLPGWCVTMIGGPIIKYADVVIPPIAAQARAGMLERVLDYYLGRIPAQRDWRVLDVGTSDGSFLRSLRQAGFNNTLMGIDPFIAEDRELAEEDIQIRKTTIEAMDPEPRWDLITFHHSLACVPNPVEVIERAGALLAPGGVCLVRAHVVPCYAWSYYGINWVGIDAPRNFFLYSPDSMEILAERANLIVKDYFCDSTAFQFWVSEQYQQGVHFYSERSLAVNPFRSVIPFTQIPHFEERAEKLNQRQQGDMAAFYLVAR